MIDQYFLTRKKLIDLNKEKKPYKTHHTKQKSERSRLNLFFPIRLSTDEQQQRQRQQ